MRKLFLFATMLLSLPLWAQNGKDHNFDVAKSMDVFNAIYKNLDFMYVDTLNATDVVGTAINAMLDSLDPYTTYYPEDKQAEYKEMMTGKYAGVGAVISYNFKLKRVVINEPYEGMPAAEAGLRKGDIILSIDGEDMTKQTNQYVSDHLRGDAGTTLELKVLRPTTGKKLTMKITRKAIQMPYLPYYGLQPGNIGYINYTQFIDGSSKDFRRAFLDLKQKGAKKLIIDLRSNGGGNVQDAISILNMFLPKGKTLLTMKGKIKSANQTFATTVEPIDTVMPIVVMVNGQTASASEITSGALQDFDRAVVLGTRTYGKGLVQVPNVPLPYNGKLKLTTAKYYIPSGRLIQAIDYSHRDADGNIQRTPDSLTNVFHTVHGREVRDGGGITPDVTVDWGKASRLTYNIFADNWAFDFANKYRAEHPSICAAEDFVVTDSIFAEFKRSIDPARFNYDKVCETGLAALRDAAKIEGYMNDSTKQAFDVLEKLLKHNLSQDLDNNRKAIEEILAPEIVSRYYYERGRIVQTMKSDNGLDAAVKVLNDMAEYRRLLAPADKKSKKKK